MFGIYIHLANPMDDDPRFKCFENKAAVRMFDESVSRLLRDMQAEARDKYVSKDNILRMNHGGSWMHAAREDEVVDSTRVISTEWTIPFKEISEIDLGLIARTISPVNEEMERQFAVNMYEVIGASVEKIGNVVDAGEGVSIGEKIIEMLRRVEFGVDRSGNVSLPQLHVSPEMAKRLSDEWRKVSPETEAEIEKIKLRKTEEALLREAERKARFRRLDHG
jgi:hypothetical protein